MTLVSACFASQDTTFKVKGSLGRLWLGCEFIELIWKFEKLSWSDNNWSWERWTFWIWVWGWPRVRQKSFSRVLGILVFSPQCRCFFPLWCKWFQIWKVVVGGERVHLRVDVHNTWYFLDGHLELRNRDLGINSSDRKHHHICRKYPSAWKYLYI